MNDLIALILGAQSGDRNFGLGGVNEISQRGIDERGLRVDVEQRGRGAFEAERETIGPAQGGSGVQLRNVAVAQLAVTGAGVLRVGGGNAHAGGVLQREFDGLPESNGLGEQEGGEQEQQKCAAARGAA